MRFFFTELVPPWYYGKNIYFRDKQSSSYMLFQWLQQSNSLDSQKKEFTPVIRSQKASSIWRITTELAPASGCTMPWLDASVSVHRWHSSARKEVSTQYNDWSQHRFQKSTRFSSDVWTQGTEKNFFHCSAVVWVTIELAEKCLQSFLWQLTFPAVDALGKSSHNTTTVARDTLQYAFKTVNIHDVICTIQGCRFAFNSQNSVIYEIPQIIRKQWNRQQLDLAKNSQLAVNKLFPHQTYLSLAE